MNEKNVDPAGAPASDNEKKNAAELAQLNLESAKESLAKLPILGPALWLYGRDSLRKFTFAGDIDWLLLPPVILDQCRLFTRAGIPTAFFTWAFVNDAIDQRLRAGGRLAPHEWKSGAHAWLIDMVTPFGADDAILTELRSTALAGHVVKTAIPDTRQAGQVVIREWPAQTGQSKDMSQGS
jgi:cytolysin-activating lysine-acyltransferase